METQDILNYVLLSGGALLSWAGKTLWSATAELKRDLAKIQAEMPMQYVLKDDYRDDIHEIKEMLKTLTQEIRNTADKIIR